MVDREALASRLAALEGYLVALGPFQTMPRERFLADPAAHHLAERYLHLACESVLDIAHHIIADQGFRQPTTYREAIGVLREQGVLDDELAIRIEEWMGFRNVLVHLYLDLDHSRVHDAIRNDLGDLRAFLQQLATWL